MSFNFYVYQNGKLMDLPLVEYQIKETDLRKKTATIKSSHYIDLTKGRVKVYITSDDHENFGGTILKVSTSDDGLYNYQCQDFSRVLQSKTNYLMHAGYGSIYKSLDYILKNNTTINRELKTKLYPKNDYKNIFALNNGMDTRADMIFEKKTVEEVLRSMVSATGCNIDLYVDSAEILRFEPINYDKWLGEGYYFTITDLTGYNFDFDVTNIITNVSVKHGDYYNKESGKFNNMYDIHSNYSSKDLFGIDLSATYGYMGTVIDVDSAENVDNGKAKAKETIADKLIELMGLKFSFSGALPRLHTNMFVWFELPSDISLENYSSYFSRMDTAYTRYSGYKLNRWYVEEQTITRNNNGLKTDLKLNPFATAQSSFYKTYTEAKNAYQQAIGINDNKGSNCNLNNSGNTITVNHMPSCGCCAGTVAYKHYQKTWLNHCPNCKSNGTLTDNPKKVHEGELTCSKCDSDFCGYCGGDKGANLRCKKKYLIPATEACSIEGTSVEDGKTHGHTDSTGTFELSRTKGAVGVNSQPAPNRVSLSRIGRTGTNYAQGVKGMSLQQCVKHLDDKLTYSYYRNNHHSNADKTYQVGLANCADTARLVKACMDIINVECDIIHVPNHYLNRVKINGQFKTLDLTYRNRRSTYNTAGLR